MDLLIKGMRLPKKGQYIEIVIDETGETSYENVIYGCSRIGYSKHQFKAIELPPHGRLGDLDALEELAFDDGSYLLIHNAPTIVEASIDEINVN